MQGGISERFNWIYFYCSFNVVCIFGGKRRGKERYYFREGILRPEGDEKSLLHIKAAEEGEIDV